MGYYLLNKIPSENIEYQFIIGGRSRRIKMNYFGKVEIDNMINKARIEIMIDILSRKLVKLDKIYTKEKISDWINKGSNNKIYTFSILYSAFIPCSDCPLYEMCMPNLVFPKCDEIVRMNIMNYRANKTLEELNNGNK